jgi:hypothetical protein
LAPELFNQSRHRVAHDAPPEEMFRSVTEDELIAQYKRLRMLVCELASGAFGRLPLGKLFLELETTSGARHMAPVDVLTVPLGTQALETIRMQAAARSIAAGDVTAFNNLKGRELVLRGGIRGTVVAIKVEAADEDVYAAVMQLPYNTIKTRGVWHVTRMWRRCYMKSITVETICESIASCLRYYERKNSVGRDCSLAAVVVGARLRMAGLRGDLRDASFIWRGLVHCFGSKDPQNWGFCRRGARRAGRKLLNTNRTFGSSCATSTERAHAWDMPTSQQWWLNSNMAPLTARALDLRDLKAARAIAGEDRYLSETFTPEEVVLAQALIHHMRPIQSCPSHRTVSHPPMYHIESRTWPG